MFQILPNIKALRKDGGGIEMVNGKW